MANSKFDLNGKVALVTGGNGGIGLGMALVGLLNKDENISTLEMKINYLRPFTEGEMIAEAKIVHNKTMTAIGDVEVKDGKGNLIAKGLATYAIFKK